MENMQRTEMERTDVRMDDREIDADGRMERMNG